jgi:hypothetical protein
VGDSSQRTLPPLLVLLAAADALRRTCKVDATGDTMDGSYTGSVWRCWCCCGARAAPPPAATRPRTHETGHTRLRSIPPVGVSAPVACCSQRTWLSAISERTSESLRNGSEHVLKCVEAARLQRRCNAFAAQMQRVCNAFATRLQPCNANETQSRRRAPNCISCAEVLLPSGNGFDMFRNRF